MTFLWAGDRQNCPGQGLVAFSAFSSSYRLGLVGGWGPEGRRKGRRQGRRKERKKDGGKKEKEKDRLIAGRRGAQTMSSDDETHFVVTRDRFSF